MPPALPKPKPAVHPSSIATCDLRQSSTNHPSYERSANKIAESKVTRNGRARLRPSRLQFAFLPRPVLRERVGVRVFLRSLPDPPGSHLGSPSLDMCAQKKRPQRRGAPRKRESHELRHTPPHPARATLFRLDWPPDLTRPI